MALKLSSQYFDVTEQTLEIQRSEMTTVVNSAGEYAYMRTCVQSRARFTRFLISPSPNIQTTTHNLLL